ncbi:MAG: hypothetical protein HY553_12950 [Elusimicrobia bacterium]|nr:hypothetical protein [Elusimicrobiota bacterium]
MSPILSALCAGALLSALFLPSSAETGAEARARAAAGSARIAVVLKESSADGAKGESFSYAADAVSRAFKEAGLSVVERSALMAVETAELRKQVAAGDLSGAASLGKRLDAEILVVGTAEGAPVADTGYETLVSHRVALVAKAYRAESQEVLATAEVAASGMDATRRPALMKAFTKAGKKAGEQLVQALLAALDGDAPVTILLSGASNMRAVDRVRAAIAGVPGVAAVHLRFFVAGSARLDARLKGISTKELAKGIEDSTAIHATIDRVTEEALEVTVK